MAESFSCTTPSERTKARRLIDHLAPMDIKVPAFHLESRICRSRRALGWHGRSTVDGRRCGIGRLSVSLITTTDTLNGLQQEITWHVHAQGRSFSPYARLLLTRDTSDQSLHHPQMQQSNGGTTRRSDPNSDPAQTLPIPGYPFVVVDARRRSSGTAPALSFAPRLLRRRIDSGRLFPVKVGC